MTRRVRKIFVGSILLFAGALVVLRVFFIDAFRIPVGSMVPTIWGGDHLFTKKLSYGIRVPFTTDWITRWASPQRGEVVVFVYPLDPSRDYIKRVIAVAGDRVRTDGRAVLVNDVPLARSEPEVFSYVEEEGEGSFFMARNKKLDAYVETAAGSPDKKYRVVYEPGGGGAGYRFPHDKPLPGLKCDDTQCLVEPGYVFVLGDNRDNSADSRIWGGVPINFVKGPAFLIWWSSSPATGIRWDRVPMTVQ